MKIVYCSTPPFADCDMPLLKALSDAGHEVFYYIHLAPYSLKATVFNVSACIPEFGIYPVSAYPELAFISMYLPNVKTFIVNNPDGKNNFKAFRLCLQEWRAISKINPDIIHYVETPSPFHLLMLWVKRRSVVCTIHDPVPHLNRMKAVERYCRKVSFQFIPKLILLNCRQSDSFCRLFHVDSRKLYYASLGPYDFSPFFDGDFAPGGRYILMFGRIEPYKGVEEGIEAMNALASTYPDVRLIIAGSGRLYFDKALYEGKPHVEIINRYITVQEQVSLIKNALFVLCPYSEATQSGVVQTALGLDTPAVVTNVGALADAIQDQVTGLVVPEKDKESLMGAMKKLLDSPEKLAEMRRNIRVEKTSGIHSWQSIMKTYIDIYRA